jgi:hypothetical protein
MGRKYFRDLSNFKYHCFIVSIRYVRAAVQWHSDFRVSCALLMFGLSL